MGSRYIRASNMSATHRLLHYTAHSINSFNSSYVPHSYKSLLEQILGELVYPSIYDAVTAMTQRPP